MAGDGQYGVVVADVLFLEEIRVAHVPVGDAHDVGEVLGELPAFLGVDVDDLDVVDFLGGEAGCDHLADFAAAEDHDTAYVHLVLAQEFGQGRQAVTQRDDVQVVMVLEGRVEAGDDGLSAAGDGDDTELGLRVLFLHRVGEVLHVHVQEGGVVVQFEDGELQFSAGKVHGVRRGAVAQHVQDFVGGTFFGEEHHVHAHVLEQEFVLGGQIGFVVYTGNNTLGSQFFGQKGAHDVHALVHGGVHGDEKICMGAAGLREETDLGGLPQDGGYVGGGHKGPDTLRVRIDDGDLAAFRAKHLGQMRSYLSCAFYDNLHAKTSLICKDTKKE